MPTTILAYTPLGTLLVAICVGLLTYRSGKDSRDKLRLDLFNRRFDIYLRTLSFYQELIGWKDTAEQKALVDPFMKASREARFIFPANSGVYEYLQEFAAHAFRITHFKETMTAFPPGMALYDEETNKVRMKLVSQRQDDEMWVLNSIIKLEDLMNLYMSFDRS